MKRLLDFIWLNKTSMAVFLTIGTLSAAIYFLSFGILWNILGLNYRIAVSLAYALCTTFHFFSNRRFTFKSHQHQMSGQVFRYLVMMIMNYVVTILIVSLVVEKLQLSPYIGICAAVSVTVVMTYLMFHFWVFSKRTLLAD